jgi:hypothetical protein
VIIKTMSEIFSNVMLPPVAQHCPSCEEWGETPCHPSDREFLSDLMDQQTRLMWQTLGESLNEISPTKASFVRALGAHSKDPMRVLAMLLLNLSQKDLSEFRDTLGIPELTHSL